MDKTVRVVVRASAEGTVFVLTQGDDMIEMSANETLRIFRTVIDWLEGPREVDLTPEV